MHCIKIFIESFCESGSITAIEEVTDLHDLCANFGSFVFIYPCQMIKF